MLTIETVAVVGASDAGTTCAVLASLAGCAVRLHEPSPDGLDRAVEAVRRRVEAALAAGVITPGERQRVLDGVLFTGDLEEAVTAADLVVHAGADAEARLDRLAGLLRTTAAVAAAGESSPDIIAARVPQPGRVLALRLADAHGPVPRLEVHRAAETAEHVLVQAAAFAERVNRAARTGGRP
jgi:3-hydroxybutyryl-CoA dehydrogenase